MHNLSIAMRYAKAALSLANKQNAADTLRLEAKSFHDLLTNNEKVKSTLCNMGILHNHKKEILAKILAQSKYSKTFQNLVNLVLARSRFDMIFDILRSIETQIDTQDKVQTIEVLTATKLTSTLKDLLQLKLKELAVGQYRIVEKVAPQILGGIILRFGNLEYDYSILGQINLLSNTIEEKLTSGQFKQ